MEKILTIIIPTYNMEKYICKCLDSLIISGKNLSLLEVLVINDGSKDASSVLAHKYESNYPQIFRVIDKENGNYGSCVNRGLKEATGKYIKVLDADDSFNTESLNQFIDILQNNDVDLILTDYSLVNEEDNELCVKKNIIVANKILSFESICNIPAFMKNIAMHAVTYKRQNLININYHQTEGISYTDEEWIFSPMSTVCRVFYANINLYKYLVGREGQTMDSKVMVKCINHVELGIISMLKSRQLLPKLSKQINTYLEFRLLSRMKYVYRKYLLESNDLELKNLISFDLKIQKVDKYLYDLGDDIVIHRFIPFKYVKVWRKNRFQEKFWFSSLFSEINNILRRT